MAALNSTNLENVVPVRIDLTGDNALWTNVTYVQQLDLTLTRTCHLNIIEYWAKHCAYR